MVPGLFGAGGIQRLRACRMRRRETRAGCATQAYSARGSFHPVVLVAVTLLAVAAISLAGSWYAEAVLLPRYCDDPAGTLRLLEKVLTEERPAGEGPRTQYVLAARVAHVLPRRDAESVGDYLERLDDRLDHVCR